MHADAGIGQGVLHDWYNGLDMGPAGKLRNDAAEDAVHVL
jgi:hypothetical protein